jgi:TfoX/Sxy family transcriptional regulator of competence genes
MATSPDFIEFVYDQIDVEWNKRYKKMFGEYMVYVNEKPLLLVCDNTVYVKKLECIQPLLVEEQCGCPYKGAKEHYIIDCEDRDLLNTVIAELEKVVPIPVKKKKKLDN